MSDHLAATVAQNAQAPAVVRPDGDLLDAEKRKRATKRLGEALAAILESDDAYTLVATGLHHRLDELKDLAESLAGP